jgi:hypothetical protein
VSGHSLHKILRAALTLILTAVMLIAAGGGVGRVDAAFSPAGWQPATNRSVEVEIRADTYGLPLHADEWTAAYSKPAVRLERGDRIEFDFQIEQYGDYVLSMDVLADPDLISAPEGVLRIDGQLPAGDVPRVVFPVFYQNRTNQFPLDRYGNQILIPQQRLMEWTKMPLRDVTFSRNMPVTLFLEAGRHSLSLEITKSRFI